MIIVNTPGSWDHVFAPFLHASWHGITPTDCVFPFFIFIVGISITLSYGKMMAAGKPKSKLVGKTVKRAILIFLIGIFLGLFPDFNFAEIRDRKSVVTGKSVSVRVDLGDRRIIKKKIKTHIKTKI